MSLAMENVISQENVNRKLTTELLPNVLITVGDYMFMIHKSCLANKSAFLRKFIEERSNEENDLVCAFTLHDFPGGARTFQIIAKFCYGQKFELTSSNVVPIICAAYYLNMNMMEDDDTTSNKFNLIFKAKKFLSGNVFSNWKESIEALISCDHEDVLNQADELGIVSRCLQSLAYKVTYHESIYPDWWYEDVCSLNLSLFKRLIEVLGEMGHDPVNISNAIAYYANEYNPGLDPNSSGIWSVEERKLHEQIVGMLPVQKGATSTKYLLSMLSVGTMLNANVRCIQSLERKIGTQLDEATLEDLLVPCFGDEQDATFDIACLTRIIENFVEENMLAIELLYYSHDNKSLEGSDLLLAKIAAVATIVDQYLAKVAIDSNLKLEEFRSLACVIPDGARPSHDGLYRAICTYIKHHPWILNQEKQRLYQLLDLEKLSRDACRE
ncbi:BTB/POZ domain-containing protein [Carex littledalei]|uniref:BTB/POZ domain-containing protein n=1 Tax=Carex littledalei TaxID=544730 RepID=A0A833QL15_9POAL|nr:BTB/POZ domain-containing protein [Carex littledalei]